ncbi:class I SAM-dependent RNA methyltransferase [Microlunatus soli]|uniref:tRNA/tmRNA/rRNA uracil-C5-methylase, TrmA/RlmC/RlmD family n=1 Tax=Microlunatus soli TaxID=630515 RepID=A0A1H1M6D5_9ACTN|nr:TRAM domain-containing protein [Microlunatus soli]SDR82338.1 tRNA/tmRNA/rRNA uracil-C5-methylase, TrmA/RlmC/RlmD family [Microlunatus soli]
MTEIPEPVGKVPEPVEGQVPEPVEGHPDPTPEPGTVVGPVTVGPIAHGGHCVARHQGRVIFTRHALPGERVMITLTDTSQRSFWRGDATAVIEPSPDRITPACEISGPGLCGGCDFQHVDPGAQRRLKADVLAEQLQRLAGLDLRVTVEEVPLDGADHGNGADHGPGADHSALGWRTRMRYQLDDRGRPGLRAHRSHQVIALPAAGCRIAQPMIAHPVAPVPAADLSQVDGTGVEVIGVAAADGVHWPTGPDTITEHAVGRDWLVAGDGFWQVHPAAADLLVRTVVDGLDPQPGETAFDLYCGVGPFVGGLLAAGCRVIGVEGSRTAIQLARRNLADAGDRVQFVADRVDRALARQPEGQRRSGDRPNRRSGRRRDRRQGPRPLPTRTDLVVLDPPRSGAGRAVVEQIVARRPRAIGYVACDPAALARDLGYFAARGYRLERLRAFDLFPMTHHLECVAILHGDGEPTSRDT